MVALEKLVETKNLTAFEINGGKVETEGRSKDQLKAAIIGLIINNLQADDGNLDTLSDLKDKTYEVKVYLEKDGVKAEDTYNVVVK